MVGAEAGEALAAVLSHPSCTLVALHLGHNRLETSGALAIVHALQVGLQEGWKYAVFYEARSQSNEENCWMGGLHFFSQQTTAIV